MLAGRVTGRFSRGRPGWFALPGVWCGEFDDLPGHSDAELGGQVTGGLGQLGALAEGASRAGEGTQVDPVELAADGRPGLEATVANWYQ
jgi:hypothetical protein